MAKVNLPPIKIPQTLLSDGRERAYFEALNFAIYQLYQRSGGGTDELDVIRERLDLIEAELIVLELRIDNIELDIIAINIRLDAIDIKIAIINARLDALEASVLALQQTFSWKTVPTGEEITIGVNQQMIVADGINIGGSLVIDGELSLI